MANCGKHFPGHGWAEADSHVALPLDSRARGDILANDAAPYRWLGSMLAGVMPAHVVYPPIDQQPAGFSRRWINLLRDDLGFTGAVFSDDLLMAGAGAAGGVAERAAAALDAGCDFALVCNDTAAMDQVLGRVKWKRSAPLTPGSRDCSRVELRQRCQSFAILTCISMHAKTSLRWLKSYRSAIPRRVNSARRFRPARYNFHRRY